MNRSDQIFKRVEPYEAQMLICSRSCKSRSADDVRLNEVTCESHNQTCESHDRVFIILDVRTPREYHVSHIEGSVNLDYRSPSFVEKISNFSRDATYLVYCRTGIRSSHAVLIMRDLGFKEVYDLSGGINRWKADGLKVSD